MVVWCIGYEVVVFVEVELWLVCVSVVLLVLGLFGSVISEVGWLVVLL